MKDEIKKKQPIKKICQSKIKNSIWKNEIQTWKKIKGDEIIKKAILKSYQLKTISNQKNIDQIWDMKKLENEIENNFQIEIIYSNKKITIKRTRTISDIKTN